MFMPFIKQVTIMP